MNNVSPDKNFYSREEKEAVGEELLEEKDNIETEESSEEEEKEETENNTSSNKLIQDEFRGKMIKLFGIVFIALVVILVVGFIISLFTKKNYTYYDVEDVIEDAAKMYFEDNKKKLPSSDEIVEITTSKLISEGYLKEMDYYIKGETCAGKVTVSKVGKKEYKYLPYLSCSNKYKTEKIINKVKDSKIVTEGFGLYSLNNEYVYRGTTVNNYIKFKDNDNLFRIVKINNNDEIVIIDSSYTNNRFIFDERYNSITEDNSGINIYKNSSISTYLDRLYSNKLNSGDDDDYYEDEKKLFTKEDKNQLVTFKSCVGARSETDTTKDGSTECKTTYETKLSLLPVYDFLNASLDLNCTSTIKPDCQNYNYLVSDAAYWLSNGSAEDTAKAYIVGDSIDSIGTEREYRIRAVAHLSSDVRYISGNGTKDKPYVIR